MKDPEHVETNNKNEHPAHPEHEVAIHIDRTEYRVPKGPITVVELKTIGSVPLAFELEQVIDGKLVPLPDWGKVDIKGGERFIGHVRHGASS